MYGFINTSFWQNHIFTWSLFHSKFIYPTPVTFIFNTRKLTIYPIDTVAKFSILHHPLLGSNGHIWSNNEHREICLDTLYNNDIDYHKMYEWKSYVFVTITCTHKSTLRMNLKRWINYWYKSEHATRSHNLRICFVSGHYYIYI